MAGMAALDGALMCFWGVAPVLEAACDSRIESGDVAEVGVACSGGGSRASPSASATGLREGGTAAVVLGVFIDVRSPVFGASSK